MRQLYRNAPLGLIATVINSAILTYVQWNVVPHRAAIIWLGFLLFLTLIQFIQIYQYHQTPPSSSDADRWNKRFILRLAVSGIAWGSAVIFLFPLSSVTHQVFLAFVLGGMVAGAAGTFPVISAFLAYSVPALVPLIIRFFLIGDEIHIAMGGMATLFGSLMLIVAMRVQSMASLSLQLRYENKSLVSVLASAKDRAEKLNEELLTEIEGRKKAQEELQKHREHLEELVAERTAESSFANARLQEEIAARTTAENTLRESEKYFRSLIENSLDIISVLDNSGSIIFESPSVEILGYTPAELVGRNVFEFVHPDDRKAAQDAFARALQSPGVSFSMEVRFRRRNGSWCVLEAAGKGIADDSRAVRVIINSRDVTERRRLESDVLKSQKLESLGVLAGGIAHDFNNLITGITANIELAKMHAKDRHALHAVLKKAEQASARAKDLTQQLLTFSVGGEPIKRVLVIGDVVKDAAEFASRGSSAVCVFSIPGELRPVEADEGQLRQAIHGIVINAVQSMPRGGVINVACENITIDEQNNQTLTPGDYVTITIADHGMGIPREHFAKIFDPYFTTKQKGSGLGLATAYSIMKKHGGSIAVDSELDVGTTITLFLPSSRKEVTAPGNRNEGLVSGSGRILIMDDEEIIRDSAGLILQTAGYDVEVAREGREAIELYRKAHESGKPFDAVILDLTVPGGIGGKDAVKELLEIDPAVKAIVSSGYSQDPIMANYRDFGFMGVIAKPYKIRDMSEIVKRVMTAGPAGDGTGPQRFNA